MKNVRLLLVLGLFAVMGLVPLAEEARGGDVQGPDPAEPRRIPRFT